MTDITKIAAACANRIFDRMEMCRGSAVLKSDIEREVEMALREVAFPTGEDRPADFLINPYLMWTDPMDGVTHCFETSEDMNEFMAAKRIDGPKGRPYPGWVDPKCVITLKQAKERGISMGAAGYIWVDDIEPGTIFGSDA